MKLHKNKSAPLRLKAEEIVQEKIGKLHTLSKEDTGRVVQESGGYQAELEMQKEALLEAQEALEVSRRRYADSYEFAPAGYFTLDPDGVVLELNQKGAMMLGFEKPSILKRPFSRFISGRTDQDRFREMVVQVFTRGTDNVMDIKLRKNDDSLFDARIQAAPAREPVVGSACCRAVVMDITECKRAEEKFQASEERFRQMADAMPQLVWTAEPDGTVDYYNKRVTEFAGFERRSDGSWLWAPVLHPDDSEKTVKVWQHAVETGKTYETEHRVRRRDGTYRWYLSRSEPVRDEEGRIVKWYGTATDIDDLKRGGKERERLVEELQRSNRELQQFAYVASHDLQEPLRAVSGYVELLAMKYRGRLDEKADKYIGFVVEGVDRLSNLINYLLAYSRVAIGEKSSKPVDLNGVLANVISQMRRAIRESGAVVTRDEMPAVAGDEIQMVQLFQNLLANAVKFRKEAVAPRVRITVEGRGNEWVFAVHDNGIGIEPRFYERIFSIFQRLHTKEEYPGTGVGLAISKRIVERHGGRIWVDSTPGEGSSFYFTLPQ